MSDQKRERQQVCVTTKKRKTTFSRQMKHLMSTKLEFRVPAGVLHPFRHFFAQSLHAYRGSDCFLIYAKTMWRREVVAITIMCSAVGGTKPLLVRAWGRFHVLDISTHIKVEKCFNRKNNGKYRTLFLYYLFSCVPVLTPECSEKLMEGRTKTHSEIFPFWIPSWQHQAALKDLHRGVVCTMHSSSCNCSSRSWNLDSIIFGLDFQCIRKRDMKYMRLLIPYFISLGARKSDFSRVLHPVFKDCLHVEFAQKLTLWPACLGIVDKNQPEFLYSWSTWTPQLSPSPILGTSKVFGGAYYSGRRCST